MGITHILHIAAQPFCQFAVGIKAGICAGMPHPGGQLAFVDGQWFLPVLCFCSGAGSHPGIILKLIGGGIKPGGGAWPQLRGKGVRVRF